MDKKEFESVKQLGEQIGYGNLMWIANCLWRKDLVNKYNLPEEGAFTPTIKLEMKKGGIRDAQNSEKIYDGWYDKFYKP